MIAIKFILINVLDEYQAETKNEVNHVMMNKLLIFDSAVISYRHGLRMSH